MINMYPLFFNAQIVLFRLMNFETYCACFKVHIHMWHLVEQTTEIPACNSVCSKTYLRIYKIERILNKVQNNQKKQNTAVNLQQTDSFSSILFLAFIRLAE